MEALAQPICLPRLLLEKAERLVREDNVNQISPSSFYVRGDTSSHFVIRIGGRYRCNCENSKHNRLKICAHIVACMIYQSKKVAGRQVVVA